MANIAEHLKEEGKLFHDGNPTAENRNNGLINTCEKEWALIIQSEGINYDANDNHLVFSRGISQSLAWLHDSDDGRRELVECCYKILSTPRDPNADKNQLSQEEEQFMTNQLDNLARKPQRLSGIDAGLKTWRLTLGKLPQKPSDFWDLNEIQNQLPPDKSTRWTSLAPIKLYWLLNKDIPIHRSVIPPMGAPVIRAIQKLYGFKLNELKRDAERSREIHTHLAELVHCSIYEINSGFYRLEGGR